MTSGIYKLEFPGGLFYIGKSENIERRWEEHRKKFETGKAAKPMQAAFQNFGYPNAHILCRAHRDNIDVLEAAYISAAMERHGNMCLNISIPEDPGFRQYEDDIANMSFKEQMDCIKKLRKDVERCETELEQQELDHKDEILSITSGTKVQWMQGYIDDLVAINKTYLERLNHLESRNWFQRLFNL
jgi:hypothetical protein